MHLVKYNQGRSTEHLMIEREGGGSPESFTVELEEKRSKGLTLSVGVIAT